MFEAESFQFAYHPCLSMYSKVIFCIKSETIICDLGTDESPEDC